MNVKKISILLFHSGANGTTFCDLQELVGDATIKGTRDFYTGAGAGKISNPGNIKRIIDSWLNLYSS